MKKPQKPVHRGTSGAAKGGGRKGGGKRHRIGGGAGVVAGGGSAAAPVKRKPAKGKGGGKKGSPSGAKVHVHHHHPKRKLAIGSAVDCCSAESLAATLRLAGMTVLDEDVLALYWRTAEREDEGASILATLEAAAEYGLAGIRPSFRPAWELRPGVIAGGWLPGGPHAVTLDGDWAWTWGERRPAGRLFMASIDEAWEVRW